jgi:hypothetical protein
VSLRKNPIAYLALFLALGGTSYAAVELPANSVGARQLRNGSVNNAKVKAHSLHAAALAAGVIPPAAILRTTVVPGAYGPPSCGSKGCPTPTIGSTVTYNANCPTGTQVISGGYIAAAPQAEVTSASVPISEGHGDPAAGAGGGWLVAFTITATDAKLADSAGSVYAVCASVS